MMIAAGTILNGCIIAQSMGLIIVEDAIVLYALKKATNMKMIGTMNHNHYTRQLNPELFEPWWRRVLRFLNRKLEP